jgi:chorismate synthase
MRTGNNGTRFLSNHAGGVLGGISTGQPVVVRFAVKPTSSILSPRQTVDRSGAETDIMTKGRHDPCVGIRAVPVGEAMMACVLADHFCAIAAMADGTDPQRQAFVLPTRAELARKC